MEAYYKTKVPKSGVVSLRCALFILGQIGHTTVHTIAVSLTSQNNATGPALKFVVFALSDSKYPCANLRDV